MLVRKGKPLIVPFTRTRPRVPHTSDTSNGIARKHQAPFGPAGSAIALNFFCIATSQQPAALDGGKFAGNYTANEGERLRRPKQTRCDKLIVEVVDHAGCDRAICQSQISEPGKLPQDRRGGAHSSMVRAGFGLSV